MKKKVAFLVALTLLTTLASTACGANSNNTKDTKKVKVGITQWTGCYAWYALDKLDIYDKYDVDVEVVMFPNFSDGVNALASGDIDTYLTSTTSALNTFANGNDIQIILVEDYSLGADAAVVKPEIQSIEDLKGKTVAAELGTGNYILMQEYLAQHGLTEKDYNYVNMSAGDAGNAFISGNVDCAMLWDPYVTESINAGGHILFTSADEEGIISLTVVANKKSIDEKETELKNVLNAWFDGVDRINSGDTEFISAMADSAGVSYEEFAPMVDTVKFLSRDENIKAFEPETDEYGYTNLRHCTRVHGDFLVDLGYIETIPTNFEELFNDTLLHE